MLPRGNASPTSFCVPNGSSNRNARTPTYQACGSILYAVAICLNKEELCRVTVESIETLTFFFLRPIGGGYRFPSLACGPFLPFFAHVCYRRRVCLCGRARGRQSCPAAPACVSVCGAKQEGGGWLWTGVVVVVVSSRPVLYVPEMVLANNITSIFDGASQQH